MFSKIFTSAALVLGLALQASAHAAVAPALGVAGTPKRSDVQRPNTKNVCGSANIANTLDTSTALTANAAGTFTAVATNFNAGADGSRSFTAKVDATGTGTKFVAAKVTTNGSAAPTDVGSQNLVVSLPAGTTCTGGKNKNTCLVQFVSTAGFGNCVAVTQGAAANTAAAATTTTTATTAATTKTKTKKTGRALRAGTTAARALMAEIAELEARAEEGIEVVKRGVSGWLFA